jgi:hypothetical protein
MSDGHGRREKLQHELREYALVSAYLFVCFSAVLFYGAAVRGGPGPGLDVLGLAAGKALILGKFTLIGEAAGIGTRLQSGTLAGHILRKLLLLFLLLLVLTVAEELIVGWIHGRPWTATLVRFESRSLTELIASCLLLLLVLAPYVLWTEVSRALGPGVLRRLLVSPPEKRGSNDD